MTTGVVDQGTFIDEPAIDDALRAASTKDAGRVREILAKARELGGLEMDEVAVLSSVSDPELLGELFNAARDVKDAIYGARLVLFAPLYVSNLCSNDCLYCAFRARNTELKRRALTQAEIRHEVEIARRSGAQAHPAGGRRVVPQAGVRLRPRLDRDHLRGQARQRRDPPRQRQRGAAHASTSSGRSRPPASAPIQLFQETYHRETYAAVHVGGKKKDYDWRVTGMHRAMEAGIDDVGIGVLFGLFDWRFEILALMQHVRELERAYGVGPHTISMPRLEPAIGSDIASEPAAPGERHRLPQDRRHPAPGRAVHRHDHEHPRDGQHPPRDLRPRRQPDLRRQPHQSRRLRGGREVRRGAVPARRPPQPRRGHPRRRGARLRAVVLHRLLPPRPHRHGLHGPGQARRDQAPLRPQRAGDLPRVPASTTAATRRAPSGEALIARKVAEMDAVRRAHTEKMLDQVRAGGRDVLC